MEEIKNIFTLKTFLCVTGASRGVGRTIALQLGANFPSSSVVVLMARTVKALESVKSEMSSIAPHVSVVVHQYDQGNVENGGYFGGIFESILKEYSLKADQFEQCMIVHNCATDGDLTKTSLQMSDAAFVRNYFDINLTGMILLNNNFFKTFSDPARPRVVINVTSLGTKNPKPTLHLYCAGKAARDMFFRVLALEEPSIRILTFSPGAVDTEMLRGHKNSAEPLYAQFIKDLYRDGKVLTTEESTSLLVQVLKENKFKNGELVDFYEESNRPYREGLDKELKNRRTTSNLHHD